MYILLKLLLQLHNILKEEALFDIKLNKQLYFRTFK